MSLSVSASTTEIKDPGADTLINLRYRQGLEATRAGLYNDALRYWLDYLELSEVNPDKVSDDEIFTAYLAAGSIHFAFEDYESAVSFFNKGNDIAKASGKEDTQIRFLNNLSGSYAEMNNLERSDSCNEAMIRIARSLRLPDYDHNYLFNKGYIAKKKCDYSAALGYMRQSLNRLSQDSVRQSPVYIYSELYAIFEGMGQLDSALYYLHRFRDLANKPHLQLDCYKGLMRIYTKLGDNEQSLLYQNRYFHLADSVLNSRDFMQTRNSWLFNEQARTQRHIAGLEENLLRWRAGIILVSCVLLLIVAFAVVLLRQKRRLNSMNADLFERNRELVRLHDRLAEEWRSQKNRYPEPAAVPAEDVRMEKADDPDNMRRQDDLLARIIDFMETSDKFLDSEFSLAQLAKEIDSNTKYVSQVINERTGHSFRYFINDYRIKVAQERMLDYASWGHLTIKSIGESVGFKSPANFIAAFKKATGMTPSVYLNFSKSSSANKEND